MFRHTRLPSHLSMAALFVCAAAFLFSIRFGPSVGAQIDPTSQQQTVEVMIATQFAVAQTATAQAGQLNLLPNSVTETPSSAIITTPSGTPAKPSGATIVVNSLDDDPRGCPDQCTFRSAVLTAKSGDTIAFDPVLAGTIILAQPITLDKDLTIVGTENDQIIFDGKDAQFSLLVVDISARVAVAQLTFRDAEGIDQSGVNSRAAINSQGTVLLTDVRFERSSLYTSGTLEAQRVTFIGNQSLALVVSGTALIQDSTFSNASVLTNGAYSAYGTGCLISNRGKLVLENVLIEDNTCDGDQTFIVSSEKEFIEAKLTITDSTLRNNTSSGGIYAGDLTLVRSTLSSNGQTGVAGIMYVTDSVLTGHEVAAVSLDGGDRSIISNSTIADNPGQGIAGFGKITVANSTIAANFGGGANVGQFFMDDNLIVSSTIIAGNTYEGNADIGGTVVSLGNNLIGDPGTTTGWFSSDLLGVDPLLAPLGDYGGPTQTMALFDGSPVIGAGYCLGDQTTPGVTADQRGVKRKDSCDIGAYETEPGTSLPAVVPTSAPTQKATLTSTVTPTESVAFPTAGVPSNSFTATAPAMVFSATANQGINVRSGPGLEYKPPIGSLAAGQTVVVLAINPKGDWYKIQYYNGEGWVGRQYVTTQGDISGLSVDDGNAASLNSDTKLAAIVLQENCILHTLQANDTPASLASLYSADLSRILEVNGLTVETATQLKIGDELLIPQEGCSLTTYQRPS